jgi:membrane protein
VPLGLGRRGCAGKEHVINQRRGWRRRGRTIFDRLRQAWREYQRDYAFLLAAAIAYYALLSLVPLLLLLLAGLGLMLRYSEFATAAEQQVLNAVQGAIGAELTEPVSQMLDGLRQESIIATVVSLIGLLVTASVLFRNLRLSFRAIWKHEPPLASSSVRVVVQETFFEQAISFAMVLAAGVLWVLSVAVLSIVQWVGRLFEPMPTLATPAAWVFALATPLLVVTVTFAFLYKVLPPVPVKWRHVLLPAALCAVAWYVTAEVIALYGVFFGRDVTAYGTLGGLLVIMLWTNVVSQLLFFGAELSKVIASSDVMAPDSK